jgi:hypothetical protein
VTGEDAEVTLHTGQIDLLDLAREQELFGQNQADMEGRHQALPALQSMMWYPPSI